MAAEELGAAPKTFRDSNGTSEGVVRMAWPEGVVGRRYSKESQEVRAEYPSQGCSGFP